jgi:hypothetical protein
MKEIKKSKKQDRQTPQPPVKHGSNKSTFPRPASGVPDSAGGSRQGNIGHQGDDNGGNSHR